ncbi:hypothetical protein [Bradyrhizobium sp. JYMT SZCCT0428]|uniref:hypothetical protein n=1 Tax=Bradyrhizobium sp. JYMT SZCCT0428 TaxID=2807673 RepID=UPI001BA7F269|nr:hypothetical protein [Bradyrhizobium sp. JYMT SZCCT0428]MBR1154348.1 hypothetical protein [Bradyrhizobium sp. JYMT SZCCT0428]
MTPEEIAVARALAEQSLLFFTRFMFKARFGSKFMVNWHHEEICEHLEAVHRGEIPRLLVNCPPGSSKTELTVINFAAWAEAKNSWCRQDPTPEQGSGRDAKHRGRVRGSLRGCNSLYG